MISSISLDMIGPIKVFSTDTTLFFDYHRKLERERGREREIGVSTLMA
jgi:hypothetical protein